MRKAILIFFAGLAPVFSIRAAAQGGREMNALMIVDSDSAAFNRDFQKYLADNGARVTDAFPPHAFMGYVPAGLDADLVKNYATIVYRAKIDDMSVIAKYGENAFFAVNIWNKHFVEDPPEAPLVISYKVSQLKKGDAITLSWNEVMRADAYKLQIASDKDFTAIALETLLKQNHYEVYPAFFSDGIYYWRVSGLLTLNGGGRKEGRFSDAYSFAVSKPASVAAKAPLPAPILPKMMALKGRKPLGWPKNPSFRHYRMQLSETSDFSAPLLDAFTDKDFYKISGLPVEYGKPYFMRVMGSDGTSAGAWSEASAVTFDTPGPIANDVRKFRPRKK